MKLLGLKVALVHDDLVQWGGAERVLVAISEIFPQAPIYTSVYDNQHRILQKEFGAKKIITSFVQKIPGWKGLYKTLLPFYPAAFERFDFSGFDLVISQTTRFAKSILTPPATKHICYCHTPPRFLWNFSGETVTPSLQFYLNFLRFYDQTSSHRVDTWIAGSVNAQERIRKIYKSDAYVLQPFVDLERFDNVSPFDGGYLLVISRLNHYKKVDLAVKAANKLKIPLKIVGGGPHEWELRRLAGPTVEFLGRVDEEVLPFLLAGCKALIVAGEEDFGLTPLEAQAAGKPVIAFKKGGALETVIEAQTGYFFDMQSVDSLISVLVKLDKEGYNKNSCQKQAARFSKAAFINKFQDFINSL